MQPRGFFQNVATGASADRLPNNSQAQAQQYSSSPRQVASQIAQRQAVQPKQAHHAVLHGDTGVLEFADGTKYHNADFRSGVFAHAESAHDLARQLALIGPVGFAPRTVGEMAPMNPRGLSMTHVATNASHSSFSSVNESASVPASRANSERTPVFSIQQGNTKMTAYTESSASQLMAKSQQFNSVASSASSSAVAAVAETKPRVERHLISSEKSNAFARNGFSEESRFTAVAAPLESDVAQELPKKRCYECQHKHWLAKVNAVSSN